jgi:hypothetical protein
MDAAGEASEMRSESEALFPQYGFLVMRGQRDQDDYALRDCAFKIKSYTRQICSRTGRGL